MKTSGEGVATIISLDVADADNGIYISLQHLLRGLQYRHPDFPQPSDGDLAKLASRAGCGYKDPRDRLQLMPWSGL